MNKEQYFNSWSDDLSKLTEAIMETIYNKYVLKCKVFQRDNFECQNENCQTPNDPLTLHHVKWQKNGGKDAVRNSLTLCKSCHQAYHKGRIVIKVKNNPNLPDHFRGHTFEYTKEESTDWKALRFKMRELRKNVKNLHGIRLTEEQIRMLMVFLFSPYEEWE